MIEDAPDKMKVADLRAALQERGLDTKGTKPVLVARLQDALKTETNKEKTEEMDSEVVASADEEKVDKMEVQTDVRESEEKMNDEDAKETEDKKEEKEKEKSLPKKKMIDDEPYEVKENEPEIPEDLTCLDWYNSDLNLKISEDLTTAQPFTRDGWGYCYAGCRATHGVNAGKVWYEVKYIDTLDAKADKDAHTNDLRVGWSTNNTGMMLGEFENSWCYSSCEGKMASGNKFEEYGEKLSKDTVIGAFLDIGETEVSITFSKDGEDQGDAYQIQKSDLPEGFTFFPHILTRNVKFQVNFGVIKPKEGQESFEDIENWKTSIGEGFTKIGKVEGRIAGTPRLKTRGECEMIMMVGLPASGKSTWVNKHVEANPDKHYNVISTAEMFKKMTVNGETRKKVHKGKWEQVIQKATRSLQDLIRTASARKRNVIIDQTNVFPNAQRRKARPFQGYVRRCVVVVPSDEDYKARVKAQEESQDKDIPDEAIMEMKANFTLPDCEDPAFAEVRFVDLDKEAASEVVALYNKIAKEKGYGKKYEEKRAMGRGRGRFNRGRGNNNFRGMRNGPHVKRLNNMRGGGRGGNMNMRGGRGGNINMRAAMRGQMFGGPMRGGRGGGSTPWINQRGGMNNPMMGGMNNTMGGGMGMGMSGFGMGNMGMNTMGGGMNNMNMNSMGVGMNSMMGRMGNMNMMSNMGMNSMGGGMGGGMGGMNNMGMGGGLGMNSMMGRMNNMNSFGGMNGMGGMMGNMNKFSMNKGSVGRYQSSGAGRGNSGGNRGGNRGMKPRGRR